MDGFALGVGFHWNAFKGIIEFGGKFVGWVEDLGRNWIILLGFDGVWDVWRWVRFPPTDASQNCGCGGEGGVFRVEGICTVWNRTKVYRYRWFWAPIFGFYIGLTIFRYTSTFAGRFRG